MIGLPEASRTIFSDDFDQESAEALDPHVQTILVFHETVGTLVKNDLLDRDLVLDWLWVSGAWDRVGTAALEARAARRRAAAVGELRGAGADPGLGEAAQPAARSGAPATIRAVAGSDRELPVAVFDSGVGGLTVLHECLVSLPHEDFLYLGDTARFPYGDRSAEELLGFARELAGILLDRGAKLLVVACNSATAAALPALREELEGRVPVVERRYARVAACRGGDRERPRGPDRHAGHRRERRLRARPRRGGARMPSSTPSPRPSWPR